MDVLRWPLRGGMLGGVVLLTALAYLSAHFEGGATVSQRDRHSYAQSAVFLVALFVLARYGWRAIVCSYPEERRPPWGPDEGDAAPLAASTGTFVSVTLLAFLPMAIWLVARRAVDPAPWVNWTVVFAAAAYAGATLPLGLAGAVVRGSPLAALPATVHRMRRAEPRAARIASATGMAFVVAFVLSFLLAALLVKSPSANLLPGDTPRGAQAETVAPVVFLALFVLRAAGFHAALVSFRVAGLLVREVPEVREAVR
jgi:hypothetical protein